MHFVNNEIDFYIEHFLLEQLRVYIDIFEDALANMTMLRCVLKCVCYNNELSGEIIIITMYTLPTPFTPHRGGSSLTPSPDHLATTPSTRADVAILAPSILLDTCAYCNDQCHRSLCFIQIANSLIGLVINTIFHQLCGKFGDMRALSAGNGGLQVLFLPANLQLKYNE